MLSHPAFLTIAIVVGAIYAIGALMVVLQICFSREGFEDENGFHYLDELDVVVVPADDVRPDWFTGALAERFLNNRPVISAGVPA